MNQSEFEHNMRGAKQNATLSDEPHAQDFWSGYQRGMRRHYHGEKFGTAEEHTLWMSATDNSDQSRRMRGLGYQSGYNGMPISEAIIKLGGGETEKIRPQNTLYAALKHLIASIKLMEQSKSAFQSATIALARAEAEKAREILEGILF